MRQTNRAIDADKIKRSWSIAFLLVFLFPVSLVAFAGEIDSSKLPPAATRPVDFEKEIKPIFAASCLQCHGPEKQKGGFRLDLKAAALKGGDDYAPAIVAGKSAQSPLIHLVSGLVTDLRMPQKGNPLTAEQIGLLRAWIDQGANWPDGGMVVAPHWSFKPPIRSQVPKTRNSQWVRNPIDSFILARLEQEKLGPSPEADRRTLIRRVSFDVTGLAPTPEEVKQFLGDRSANAYEKLVDHLLASPRYGERWARHWLDVVRFAETTGFEVNTPRNNAWPYRDYVIKALNEDKPYNEFVMEQLAGDALGAAEATGFIVGGPNDQVKSPDIVLTRQQRADELHDMVSTTGSAFLGLTVGCARCHNHKFDPISQVDYYAMTAVFSGVQHGERQIKVADHDQRIVQAKRVREAITEIEGQLTPFEPLADPLRKILPPPPLRPAVHPKQNVDRFTAVEAKFLRFTISETTGVEPCLDELEIYTSGENSRNVALASTGAKATASSVYPNAAIHKLEHINDGLYGNDHSWISSETGKGWVQIEFPERVWINKVVWGRDREEKFSDRLATDYKIEVATDTNDWKVVSASNDRQNFVAGKSFTPTYSTEDLSSKDATLLNTLLSEKTELETKIRNLTTFPVVYAGTFTKPEATYRLHRGDPMQPREEIQPGSIAAFPPKMELPAGATEQQRRLALARWIIAPQNPLTARVLVNRIWQHHFGEGIVSTPSDFGINGARPSHPELLDWLATELVRQNWSMKAVHRLILLSSTYQQSSVVDTKGMAADAGNRLLWRVNPRRLEAEAIRDAILETGGTLDLRMGGPGYQVFESNENYVRVYEPRKQFGPPEWRRMIYQFKPRMQQDATFGAFDCPDGGQIAPRRNTSTTPLQALNLLNSRFMIQQSDLFAERLQRDVGANTRSQVRRAFSLAFNREPAREELTAATILVEKEGLRAFCQAMFNANEFLYVF